MSNNIVKYDKETLLKLKTARAYLKPILTSIKAYSDSKELDLIDHMMDRIKDPESAREKLLKKGCSFTQENLFEELNDLVGFRIICPFRDDVFNLVRSLEKSGIEIIDRGDYVTVPKKSGYTSYHLDVLVPININGKKEKIKCEIQIRSMAMDLWATQDHDLRYKTNNNDLERIEEAFSRRSQFLDLFDQEMSLLRKKSTLYKPFRNKRKDYSDIIDAQKVEFYRLNHKCKLAQNKLESKIQRILLNYDYFNDEKIVNHMKSRIKSNESALEKLERRGHPLTVESINENLGDMVGIRLICPFITNVYELVEFIKTSDLEFIGMDEDYIKYPKESGYSSYHLHVNVPVNIGGNIEYVKSEIQIRTIAMDLWATLEHKIRENMSLETYEGLKYDFRNRAYDISDYDHEVDKLYREAKGLDNADTLGEGKGQYVLKS